jgi:hypothetical protein
MKLHQHFEFGPASQNPFSFCQIQLALDTVRVEMGWQKSLELKARIGKVCREEMLRNIKIKGI